MRRTAGRLATLMAIVGWSLVSGPAPAESSRTKTPPLPPVPPPALQQVPTPYDGRLNKLAELMGTLAYLRDLCGAGDGKSWRDKMSGLIDAEAAPTDARRERLAGSFNRGFEGYRMTYRHCTPAARIVITRALAEGTGLAADLERRFGTE